MSQALAEAGARVVLTGRTEPPVRDAATRIARGVTGLVMDVRDEQSVSAGLDRALAILGGVDVLVNNAGIGMRTESPTRPGHPPAPGALLRGTSPGHPRPLTQPIGCYKMAINE